MFIDVPKVRIGSPTMDVYGHPWWGLRFDTICSDVSSGHDVGGCADCEDDECAQTHEDFVAHGGLMLLTLFI